MAAACEWVYREPTNTDFARWAELRNIFPNYPAKIYEVDLYQEAPDAKAEIRVLFTHLLDGTTSPVLLDVVSSSADDKGTATAGTGARTVGLLGISATSTTGVFTLHQETIIMAGATPVETLRYYKRVINIKVLTAGSGKKAAGIIEVHEKDGTTKDYATIAANGLSSISARFYIPTGFSAAVIFLQANVINGTGAAAVDVDAGTTFFPITENGLLTKEVVHGYTLLPGTIYPIPPHRGDVIGNNDRYITLSHITVNTGKNKDTHYDIKILVWETRDSNTI